MSNKPSFKNFFHRNVLPEDRILNEIATKQTLSMVLTMAASNTWHLSDYDPLNRTMDGVSLLEASRPTKDGAVLADEIRLKAQAWGENYNNPTAITASFLGLPTKPPIKNRGKLKEAAKLEVKDIAKSFVGLDQTRNPLKIAGITLWNSIKMPLKLARNILRVFTEFLPRAIEDSSKLAIAKTQKKIKELNANYGSSRAKKVGFMALNALAHISYFGGKIWRLVGRAITSPGDSVLAALKSAEEIGGTPGKVVAGLLAALSIATTITAYTILFPLMLANTGSAMASLANLVKALPYGSNVINALATAMSALGQTVLYVLDPLMSALGLQAASAALIGAATTFAIAGSPAERFLSSPKKAVKKGLNLLAQIKENKKEAMEMQPVPTKSFNEKKIEQLLGATSYQEKDSDDTDFLAEAEAAIQKSEQDLAKLANKPSPLFKRKGHQDNEEEDTDGRGEENNSNIVNSFH